ncbi:MAG: hypothetical protein KUG81_09850 [Gammaproteobacteria bacterium]|nr:hypothetical protein [Gammaproteobacteria bacterium]
MAKQIKFSEIVDDKSVRSGLDDILGSLTLIDNKLQDISKTSKDALNLEAEDSFKNIKKVNEAISQSNDAFETKLKIDKERVKVQKKIQETDEVNAKNLSDLELKIKKLNAAKSDLLKKELAADKQRKQGNEEIADAIKLTAEERVELAKITKELVKTTLQKSEQLKANKELAKDSLGLIDLYSKESKRLNQLRKDYKNLVLAEGSAANGAEELKREIDDLDKKLKDVDASAGQFQRNVGNYPDTIGDATDSILKFTAATVGAKLSLDGIQGSLEDTQEGSEAVREVSSSLGGVFDQVSNVVASASLDLFDLGKGLANGEVGFVDLAKSIGLASIGMSGAVEGVSDLRSNFNRTTSATENFTDKVEESANAQLELERRVIAFEKAIRPLEIRLSRLNGLVEEQQIIAGDTTRSFEEIRIAVLEGQKLQIERANILLRISREELAVSQERIRVANLAGGARVELLDAETDAITKVIEAENDLKNELLENEKELRQIKQDRLEIDLDILIDGFDNQKTINERIIANERETLSKRAALLEQTNKLAEESFRGQKEVLEELSAAGINVDDLLLLDATELAKQIRLLEQSEIINTRTLEVVRERRIVIQDLADAQQDLNDAEQEGIDLRADILAQEEALGQITRDSIEQSNFAIQNLEETREANEIASLERRLEVAKEGSIEQLTLQKELNDLLLSEQERKIAEQEKLEIEAARRREEIQKALFNKLQEASDKRSEENIANIDKQIEANEKQQDALRASADRDVLGADQSLASEKKRAAELERERQEEVRKQELKSAGFKILSALLEQGKSPQEAIPEVGVLLGALPAVIDAIPTFYTGTNTTVADALGSPHLNTSRDGYIIRADGNEKILNPSQSARTGGRTTEDITSIVENHDKGLLGGLHDYQPQVINTNWQSNDKILSKFNSLESSIVETNKRIEQAINNQPVLDAVKFNKITKEMTSAWKSSNKTTNVTSSVKSSIFN